MRKQRLYSLFSAAMATVSVLFLAACPDPNHDPQGTKTIVTDTGFIVKQWSDAIVTLNYLPVYPPSEDIQVGDVFIVDISSPISDSSSLLGRSALIGHADVTSLLNAYYGSRLVFPKTSSDPGSGKIWSQTEDSTGIFNPTKSVERLPLVGLPGFVIARGTAASFQATVPVQVIQASLGASDTSDAMVQISVPAAETYGLPLPQIASALVSFCATPESQRACFADWAPFFATQVAKTSAGAATPALYIVYKVLYARSITYTYSSSAIAAARASLALNAGGVSSATLTASKGLSDALSSALSGKSTTNNANGNGSSTDATKSSAGPAAPVVNVYVNTGNNATIVGTSASSGCIPVAATPPKASNPTQPAQQKSLPGAAGGGVAKLATSTPLSLSVGLSPSKPVSPTNAGTTLSGCAGSPDTSKNGQGGGNGTTSTDVLAAQLQQAIQQLGQLNGNPGGSGPGLSVSGGYVASDSIALTQTFERPVAIGYRAFVSAPLPANSQLVPDAPMSNPPAGGK